MKNLNEQINKMKSIMGLSEGVGYDTIDLVGGIELIRNRDRSIESEDSYDIIDGVGKNLGFVHIVDRGDYFQVANVNIRVEKTGLGYILYKKLISILSKPLVSDDIMSSKVIGLWDKLVNDGFAERFRVGDGFKYRSVGVNLKNEGVNDGVNEGVGGIEVYHGCDTKISSFVDDFVGGKNATDQEGPGIYFTTSKENAQRYGENIYVATLMPRKLLSEKPSGGSYAELLKLAKMAPEWEDTAQNWDENPSVGIVKAVKDAIQYNENEKDRFLQIWIYFYRNNPRDYVRNCVKLGYDGIVVDRESMYIDEPIKHYIVYNPSIIQVRG